MRILNEVTDQPIKRVALYLTIDEAKSLLTQLDGLISKPKRHHIHVEDASNEREITVAIYSGSNLSQFDERSRRLIEKDE
jgi:hypothetical protein